VTLAQFEGGPMDRQVGEYDLEDQSVLYDCGSPGLGAVYRRSGEVVPTPYGDALVYQYVGPALLGQ
jgi:hypothetical protein